MKRAASTNAFWIVAIVTIILMGWHQPASAQQEQLLTFNPIAMGGNVEPQKSDATQPKVSEPTLMIRIGDAHFDPLYKMPSAHTALKTIDSYAAGQSGYYIVQFDGPVQPAWKQALSQAGAEILDYLPDFAYVVRMLSDTVSTVSAIEHVRWVGIFQPAFRISQGAMSRHYSQGQEQKAVVALRVNLFPGVDTNAVEDQIRDLGGVIKEKRSTKLKTSLTVEIPAERIANLPAIDGVKWIEPMPQWKLSNDVSTDIMNVRTARNTNGLYGSGQTVGVADTGLDNGDTAPANLHDDFEDGSGASRVLQIIDRVAAAETGVDQSDTNGHGTHVAGSVLGNGLMSGSDPSTNSFPETAVAGLAPKANLVFQALENNDTGLLEGLPNDLNDLFSQAAAAGADLHTNSWGASVAGAYTAWAQDVDEYMWNYPDFLILFSASNDGADLDADGVIDPYSLGSPATAKNCLTVGASESDRSSVGYDDTWTNLWGPLYPVSPISNDHVSDNDRGIAAFSSRGPTLDGRYKPELVAPGTNILSTRTGAVSSAADIGWGNYNDDYVWMGGTSMATPLTAGAATLMREYLIKAEGFASPSAALIKAALINSAEDISPGQYGTGSTQEIPDGPTPSNVQGWGRVNLGDGVYPTAPFNIIFHDETTGLNTGGTDQHVVSVSDSGAPLRISLCWTDYPGSPAAQGGLVNDLDLQVTAPSSAVHYADQAVKKTAASTLNYDNALGTMSYAGNYYAVRFTPSSYPASLDSTTFYYINNGTSLDVDVVVYGDNAGLPDPSDERFRKTLSYVKNGFITIPINIAISSGDVHVALERPASTDFGTGLLDNGNPTGRTSWKTTSGGSWATSSYTALIRANMRYAPDFATSFDRVNNTLSLTLDTPATGDYTIQVAGYNVPQGPQPYALVASGNITSTSSPTSPGVVQFASSAYAADENSSTATLTISRTLGSDGAASVNYATSDGSATAGSDYTAASGTLNWSDGDSSDQTITITINDDSVDESNETINVALSSPTGASLGSQSTVVLTINDNDSGGGSGGSSGGGSGGGCFLGSAMAD